MLCFVNLRVWESLQIVCWCSVWWNGVVWAADPNSIEQRAGINLQQCREEPCYIRVLFKAKGNKERRVLCSTLSSIVSHHSFPLQVFLFCFLYGSTLCSDVFILFLVCLYEPGFDFSPDFIPRLIPSILLSYARAPTEADKSEQLFWSMLEIKWGTFWTDLWKHLQPTVNDVWTSKEKQRCLRTRRVTMAGRRQAGLSFSKTLGTHTSQKRCCWCT